MLTGKCHCGTIQITFPPPRETLNDCHCSICRRYGTLWAYYDVKEVQINGESEGYLWGDKELTFHRCRGCGCVTHWWPTDKAQIATQMGINCRILEMEDFEKLEIEKSPGP